MTSLPTIPARHNRLGEEAIYRFMVQSAVWRAFDTVWLHQEGPLPNPQHGPIIGYLNHTAWWDGYMIFLLHRMVLRRRFQQYLMMDLKQLRQFPFFSWAGVFSVDRRSPDSAACSVDYAAEMIRQGGNRMLWIFPQGQLLPNDVRPLVIRPGIVRIAQQSGVRQCWPVAVRFEFRNQQRPEAFIRTGTPHLLDLGLSQEALQAEIAAQLTRLTDTLRDDVVQGQTHNYQPLMRGMPGIDRLTSGLLSPLVRAARRLRG